MRQSILFVGEDRRGAAVRSRSGDIAPQVRSGPLRWLWFGMGCLAVGLGGLGIVVPGLPTTGFFVAAASCFARSSPRFERWVLSLPTVGPLVRDYRAGLGMPRRAKVVALMMIVTAVAASAGFALDSPLARGVVLGAGLVGVWYVGLRIPTRPDQRRMPAHR